MCSQYTPLPSVDIYVFASLFAASNPSSDICLYRANTSAFGAVRTKGAIDEYCRPVEKSRFPFDSNGLGAISVDDRPKLKNTHERPPQLTKLLLIFWSIQNLRG